MLDFSIGLSAISAQQRALDIIGENIANAGTPGYHRQEPLLTERAPLLLGNLLLGSGVDAARVQRLREALLENSITQNTFESSSTNAQLDALRQIESSFTPGDGSIDQLLEGFFNQLEQLAATPDDPTERQVFLNSATALTNQLNSTAGNLAALSENLDSQIQEAVAQVNSLSQQIAQLNGRIQQVEIRGISANDLRDQRDELVNQLAQLIDVRTTDQGNGVLAISGAGAALVAGTQAGALTFSINRSNSAVVTAAGSSTPLAASGGKLAGLLAVRNQVLPAFQSRLNQFTQALIQSVDEIQATGLGLTGPSSFLAGTRGVSSTALPLSRAGLAFPPHAGSLVISVTDQATGNRTISEVQIDPATQSLQDVAAAISSVPHLQAVIDPQTRTLRILAQPGFAFDFAGRLATAPDSVSISGTTTPQIGGAYTGTTNDTLTYRVVGSGTVGVTSGLNLQVTNSAGTVIATLNVGQGYEPGSVLQVGNGVTVQLSAGTANAGDQFTTRVIGNPDSSGILTALGLNTFFTGTDASSVRVADTILNQPGQLAGSRSGQPGDAANLQRIAALRDLPLLAGGTQTLGQFYAAIVGDVGTRVQGLSQQQSAQQLVAQNLTAQQQSVSGVDPNEELVHLVESQKAYQLAAKYISTVNATLDDLFQIVGISTTTG